MGGRTNLERNLKLFFLKHKSLSKSLPPKNLSAGPFWGRGERACGSPGRKHLGTGPAQEGQSHLSPTKENEPQPSTTDPAGQAASPAPPALKHSLGISLHPDRDAKVHPPPPPTTANAIFWHPQNSPWWKPQLGVSKNAQVIRWGSRAQI